MDWHCLGHATWLVEVDGLRLLFDPLLEDLHHGGVFEVYPPRAIDAAALRPDFILVSHRHPDHFDIPSLRRLAALDADTVVVTPDDLVANAAERLGFRTVRRVAPETRVELDGPRLLTTPSASAVDPEWGVIVESAEGIAYNQVDTSLGKPDEVRAFLARASEALGRQDEERLLTLALVRWQPLLEIEAVLAERIGFPYAAYAAELDRAAALDARVVCPSSSGVRHAAPYASSNRLVYPVTETRYVEDARARMPGSRVVPLATGASYRLRAGDVVVDPRGATSAGLVSVTGDAGDADAIRDFRPLAIPPLVDPNFDDRSEPELRARIDGWIFGTLAPALANGRALHYLLEIVLPTTTDTYTIVVRGGTAEVRRAADPRWDLRCAVAGSLLVDVLDARRHWGDLLLGGMLRGCSRAYEVDARGLRRLPEGLSPLFLYRAIAYDESVRRAIDGELSRA